MDCATATEIALDSLLAKRLKCRWLSREIMLVLCLLCLRCGGENDTLSYRQIECHHQQPQQQWDATALSFVASTHTIELNWSKIFVSFSFVVVEFETVKNCISIVVVAFAVIVGSWRWTNMSLHWPFDIHGLTQPEERGRAKKLFAKIVLLFADRLSVISTSCFFTLLISFAIQLRINVKCTSMTQAWQNAGHSTAPHRATHITQHDISLGNILQKTKRWTI